MAIVKQDSFIAGEISPELTEAVNNELYFTSALRLENVYISKFQTIKRTPSTKSTKFNPTATAQIAISARFAGEDYIITWDSGVYNFYKFNTVTEELDFIKTDSPTPTLLFNDYVTFDDKVVFTYPDGSVPQIVDFVSLTDTLKDFTFINEPTIDFGTLDYSDFVFSVPASSSGAMTVTVTAPDVSGIDASYVGGMFYSIGKDSSEFLGQGKITSVAVGTTSMTFDIKVIQPFAVATGTAAPTDTNEGEVKGSQVVLQQPIFSYAANNYPKVVAFFDSRLYFGNTASLPMLVSASRVNIVNDFNVGKSLPAEAIVYVMNDTTSSEVRHIVGHIGLFVHTDQNEHVVIPSIEDGITPDAFIAQRLSDWGSNNIKPIVYSNSVMFVNKTNRKIIKVDSSSASAFNTTEITIGMRIDNDINSLGVIDDPLIDNKLLAFSIDGNNNQLQLVAVSGNVNGRTRFDFIPSTIFAPDRIFFGELNNKTLLMGFDSAGNSELAFFDDTTTGLTLTTPITAPLTYTDATSAFFYNPTSNTYLFAAGGGSTDVPTGYTVRGYQTSFTVQSVPLVEQNAAAWDRKEISYVYISYFESARFFVNGAPVAFPTVAEISQAAGDALKTDFRRIPTATNQGLINSDILQPTRNVHYNYILITSDQPYPVNIQAYGWNIKTSIMG